MKTLTHTTNDPAMKNDPILIKKKELAKRLSVSPHTTTVLAAPSVTRNDASDASTRMPRLA